MSLSILAMMMMMMTRTRYRLGSMMKDHHHLLPNRTRRNPRKKNHLMTKKRRKKKTMAVSIPIQRKLSGSAMRTRNPILEAVAFNTTYWKPNFHSCEMMGVLLLPWVTNGIPFCIVGEDWEEMPFLNPMDDVDPTMVRNVLLVNDFRLMKNTRFLKSSFHLWIATF